MENADLVEEEMIKVECQCKMAHGNNQVHEVMDRSIYGSENGLDNNG